MPSDITTIIASYTSLTAFKNWHEQTIEKLQQQMNHITMVKQLVSKKNAPTEKKPRSENYELISIFVLRLVFDKFYFLMESVYEKVLAGQQNFTSSRMDHAAIKGDEDFRQAWYACILAPYLLLIDDTYCRSSAFNRIAIFIEQSKNLDTEQTIQQLGENTKEFKEFYEEISSSLPEKFALAQESLTRLESELSKVTKNKQDVKFQVADNDPTSLYIAKTFRAWLFFQDNMPKLEKSSALHVSPLIPIAVR